MLNNIYNTLCELLILIDRVQRDFYIQDYYNGMKIHRKILNILTDIIKDRELSQTLGAELAVKLPALLNYQQAEDYIGMADFYVMQLKPLCESYRDRLRADGIWQEVSDRYAVNYDAASESIRKQLNSIDAANEDIPAGYELIETATGDFTLQVQLKMTKSTNGQSDGRKILLASANNPMAEAELLVESYCKEACVEVTLLGFAMGHIIRALVKRDDVIRINLYEPDKYVIKAAFHYADLTDICKSGKVNLVYDPMLVGFSRKLAELSAKQTERVGKQTQALGKLEENPSDNVLIIHRPSMVALGNEQLRDRLQDFFLHDSSVRSQLKKLYGNFRMNTSDKALANVKSLDELEGTFAGKQMLLIAGGPSLEDNMPLLVQSSEEYVITTYSDKGVESELLANYMRKLGAVTEKDEYIVVCVGTVLSRLVSYGIIPDYVVMIDAQDTMVNQIAGVDTSKLSLIYLPTLYYGVPQKWQGRKYMGLQKGFELSETMAAEAGRRLYESGGSVSTFALDIGLRFKCSKIVCMGLDLAYVDNKRHAGEAAISGVENETLRELTSIEGKTIYTSTNLDNYRLWIERRIANRTADEMKVELINVSRGAKIEGMVNEPGYFG